LILDEPTNHLDIESIETFEEALEAFRGTIFFISHDRYFISKISDRVIAIENCNLVSYDEGYEAYKVARERLIRAKLERENSEKKIKVVEKAVFIEKEKRLGKNPKRIELDLARAEALIHALENEKLELDQSLKDTTKDYEMLSNMYNRRQQIESELENVMIEWLDLQTMKQEM
jgi:ATPase subunit of ABC transporter with duplicated ATPase domains